jgi:hypothetical protein
MSFELTPDEAKKVISHLNRVHAIVTTAEKSISEGLECVLRRPIDRLPVELQTAVDLLHEVDGILTCWVQNRPHKKEIYSST